MLTTAGFNRRMRKTACPVVWKAHGAQSPWAHPISNIRAAARVDFQGSASSSDPNFKQNRPTSARKALVFSFGGRLVASACERLRIARYGSHRQPLQVKTGDFFDVGVA